MSELIPGLPDDVLKHEIIPRVPWYTRPLLRCVSSSWCWALKDPEEYVKSTRRHHHLQQGLFLAVHKKIRRIEEDALDNSLMFFNGFKWYSIPHPPYRYQYDSDHSYMYKEGILYLTTKRKLESEHICLYKLDIASGSWWQALENTPRLLPQLVDLRITSEGVIHVLDGKVVLELERHDCLRVTRNSIVSYVKIPASMRSVEIERIQAFSSHRDGRGKEHVYALLYGVDMSRKIWRGTFHDDDLYGVDMSGEIWRGIFHDDDLVWTPVPDPPANLQGRYAYNDMELISFG